MYGSSLSADGLTLYLAVTPTGGSEHIYRATRTGRVAQFSAATAVASVNSASAEGNPYLSYDGLTLYFYSTRPGGLGGRDLWHATRPNTASDFANPTLLAGMNSTTDDHLPWVSRDELTLLFVSSRNGLPDVWIATRTSKSLGFSVPEQLSGTDLNSSEGRAAESNDGLTVFFSSNRLGTLGSFDFWYASRPNTQAQFSNATNLTQLNSTTYDVDLALSSDETEVLFSSGRSGTNQLWRSVRACQ
jgi:Tol biopolymer transport system component